MWLSLIVPFVFTLFILFAYSRNITLWEIPLPFLGSILITLLIYPAGKAINSYEIEYLGSSVQKIQRYEYWNEYIEKTCTETYQVRQSDGSYKTETREYKCDYIEDHYPYYTLTLTTKPNYEIVISKERYYYLLNKFGTKEMFKELNRDYHTIDGDMFIANWSGSRETHQKYVETHSYVNKVRNSDLNLFNMNRLTDTEAIKKGLYKYPELNDNLLYKSVLSKTSFPKLEEAVSYLNSTLGKSRQVRVWFLIFNDADYSIISDQENYWVRGNKNEIVIVASLNSKTKKLDWVGGFSWTADVPFVEIQDRIMELDTHTDSSLSKFVNDYLYNYVNTKFIRKQFKDFDYLDVKLPNGAIILNWILVIIFNMVISFWIVNNEFD